MNEATLIRAALSSEYAANCLLVAAQALIAGYGDQVDQLGQLQPHTREWDLKIAELRRLVGPDDDWQPTPPMLH